MAAPLTKRQRKLHTESIRTSKLIKKLQKHVLGDEELSNTQLKAAIALLDRTMPRLKAVEVTAKPPTGGLNTREELVAAARQLGMSEAELFNESVIDVTPQQENEVAHTGTDSSNGT